MQYIKAGCVQDNFIMNKWNTSWTFLWSVFWEADWLYSAQTSRLLVDTDLMWVRVGS